MVIKSIFGKVLFSAKVKSLRELVELAVARNVNLTMADLSDADLSDANLANANLTGANLYHANLTGANLYHANLTGTRLRWADLTGAILTGVKFDDDTLMRAGKNDKLLIRLKMTS